jgi:hypothetical protein
MKEWIRSAIALVSLLTLTGGCTVDGGGSSADLAELEDGWNVIEPGGETACSDGSPYHFLARPGDADRLLVYFQGGGSCWDGVTCDTDLEPVPYTVNLDALDPARAHGIFAFDVAENPFRDHSVVVAPYCSADVHIGDRVATYRSPDVPGHAAHDIEIQHKGMVNSEAVLDWTIEHFDRPASIFVAGSSAGSIPSPFYAMRIAEQYPDARVQQLGDGSSGYRRDGMSVTPEATWGTLERLRFLPEFADLEVGEMSFELLYAAAANRTPRVGFAAFDHAEDDVQKDFLELAGIPRGSLLPLILANQADIRSSVAGFRSYIAGGDLHTILLRPQFYTQHVDGVRVRDWVAALAEHRAVDDVRCDSCAVGEFIELSR